MFSMRERESVWGLEDDSQMWSRGEALFSLLELLLFVKAMLFISEENMRDVGEEGSALLGRFCAAVLPDLGRELGGGK